MRISGSIWRLVCIAHHLSSHSHPGSANVYTRTDLTSLFNWNTKQVFVYIKAVYPSLTPTHPPSEAIIWDAILASRTAPWHTNHYTHPDPKSKSGKKSVLPKKSKKALAASKSKPNPDGALIYPRGTLKLPNQRPKYQITDISGKMQGRENVTLEIGWNVQPWVGAQMWTTWEKVGAWEGLRGGRSAGFGFPAIAQGVKKGGLETEKGAEGFRLEVGQNAPGGKGKA